MTKPPRLLTREQRLARVFYWRLHRNNLRALRGVLSAKPLRPEPTPETAASHPR